MKIDEGKAMAPSSKNFDDGMILPRATPARSGTRHSISVTPRAAAQAPASARLVIGGALGRLSVLFFLGHDGVSGCFGDVAEASAAGRPAWRGLVIGCRSLIVGRAGLDPVERGCNRNERGDTPSPMTPRMEL